MPLNPDFDPTGRIVIEGSPSVLTIQQPAPPTEDFAPPLSQLALTVASQPQASKGLALDSAGFVPPETLRLANSLTITSGSLVARSSQAVSNGALSIASGTDVFRVNEYGDVFLGVGAGTEPHSGSADNWGSFIGNVYSARDARPYFRQLIVRDVGDAPEIQIARAGGTYPDGPAVGALVNEGSSIWWGSYTTPIGGTPGVTEGGTFTGISDATAVIVSKLEEDAMNVAGGTNAGGELRFQTRPKAVTTGAQDRLVIRSKGAVGVLGATGSAGDLDTYNRGSFAAEELIRANFKSANNVTLLGAVGPSSEGGLKVGSASSTGAIYLSGNLTFRTDSNWQFLGPNGIRTAVPATTESFQNRLLAGDSQPAHRTDGDGDHHWGVGGSTAVDTSMGRVGVGILKANEAFHVGTDFRHLGSNLGFYGVAQVARPSAYTQTYATADKTHANPTAATLTVTDGAGTNDNTIDAITADASVIAAVQEIADEINKLVADVADVKQVVNSVIDDLQALGLAQ